MELVVDKFHQKILPFMEYLEHLTERPQLDDLVARLESFDVSVEELGQNVQFHSNHYRRNLMFENEHVQLLCLCWKSGQCSPIHDHAQSICGVKVIDGICAETVYERTPSGYMKPLSTVEYGEGVLGSQDDDTHQISNYQSAGQNLVTLHCYAPPLKCMKTFSSESNFSQIYQPINDWQIDGSGI